MAPLQCRTACIVRMACCELGSREFALHHICMCFERACMPHARSCWLTVDSRSFTACASHAAFRRHVHRSDVHSDKCCRRLTRTLGLATTQSARVFSSGFVNLGLLFLFVSSFRIAAENIRDYGLVSVAG